MAVYLRHNRFRPLMGYHQVLIVLLYCNHVLFFYYLVEQSCLRLLLSRPDLSCSIPLLAYVILSYYPTVLCHIAPLSCKPVLS
jgi:hypothetical protein